MPFKEKILLAVLAAIQFAHILDFMIMMPLGPQLMRIFDIYPKDFALLVSSYTFAAGLSGFVSIFYVDKFDRKAVLSVAFAGFLICTFFCGLASSFQVLLFARVCTGIFGGILSGLLLSILGDAIPFERRGLAMGITMMGFSVASVVGVPLGLYVANMYDWHAPFLFLSGFSILILIAIFIFIPSFKSHLQANEHLLPWDNIQKILKDTNSVIALCLMLFLVLGQFTIIPFISPYMVSNVGFTEHDLTFIYFIGGIASIIASPLLGKLADVYGKGKIFTIFCLLTLIPIYLITNMPKVEIYMALTVTTIFFIFMSGRMGPAMAMITSSVNPQYRGSFMAMNATVQQLSSALAAYISGIIVSKNDVGQIINYQYVGFIAVFFSILAILFAIKLKPVQ
ncbi:MAG: MFS transporter [Cytophagales bacterium]|nr:MFS transporter [Cytophagales bacterium]